MKMKVWQSRVALGLILGLGWMSIWCQGEDNRRLVQRYTPDYPEIARQMRVTGTIVLKIVIAADGHVSDIQLESGHPLLVRAAQDAVRKWRYAPSASSTTTVVEVSYK